MKTKTIIFLAVLTALLATSCAETFINGPEKEISFVAGVDVATKAPLAGTTFPTSRPLTMSAYYNAPAGATVITDKDYFIGIPFAYRSASSAWAAATPKYWPQNGSLDFLAYSVDGLTPTTATWNATNSSADVTLVLPDNSTIQDDVLFGAKAAQTGATNPFAMTFSHAQAQVAFTAASSVAYDAGTNVGVTITGITLASAKYSGTVKATRSTDAVSYTWSSLGSAKTLAVPGITASNLAASQAAVGSGVVLPQQEAVGFTVYYTLHNGMAADGTTPLNATLEYTWTPSGSTTWMPGNRYVYAITFTLNEILVSPSITDWSTSTTPAPIPQS